ncbi:glycosyltransferase [Hansschlegelia zhihuaiae]|uniref:Glycosyltransferase n=1 Tax=Hansschlegelia zhihuaiae TaxID=405005 RepID=A0A4Q0MMD5_9HYPH|nr:nucleotide disphospho-sugar-binding domain-containing protein [Hansschlegelia zhihuaiae]RXF74941.1 glycosyltransferase [Hansschlegelia zhihuaiae]
MRILVVSIGTYGDVLPFIAMAAELDRRGHHVTLASAATFEAAARRAGVDFEPLMSVEDYSELFEHPQFWRPFHGARRLFSALPKFLKPTHDFVARHHVPGETLVIASALAMGARIVRETMGAPIVSVHLAPIMFISRDDPPRTPYLIVPKWLPKAVRWRLQTGLYTEFIAPLILPGLNEFRRSIGLKARRRIRSWWQSSQLTLLLFPSWFASPQPEWPKSARQLDFPRADMFGAVSARLDRRLDAFLDAGEKPVAITFGSGRLGGDAVYRATIEACLKLGRRCLVLSHQELDIPSGHEDQVFFSRYAPLSEVLPRCAALVHHGGVGTVAMAFAAGVPQLISPLGFDQFDHAVRVRRLGAGLSLSRSHFNGRRAATALRTLLSSPLVAERCARIAAATSKEDVIAKACDVVEAEFSAALEPRGRAREARRAAVV